MIRCRLSGLLGDRRMKMSHLARKTGLAYTTVNDIYNERTKRIDYHSIDVICRVLDCQVGDLLEYVSDAQ